jgi:hypothetical protein
MRAVTHSPWFGPVMSLLVIVAALALGMALCRLRTPPPSSSPSSGAAFLSHEASLLVEPRADAASLATLPAGTRLLVIGRTGDAAWLYGTPADRTDVSGWVPAGIVSDVSDLSSLARVDSSAGGIRATQAGGNSPRPGPRPDLAIHAVSSRQDRLSVLIANDGDADFVGTILVSVDGGTPERVDVGKPLRPGEALDAVIPSEYVQRRARVVVTVTSPGVTEATIENNRLEVVVGPDQPINLSLESATVDPVDGHLTVDVRNRGPIPLVGTLTIGVREGPPSNRLVLVSDADLHVGAGGLQQFRITPPSRIDLSKMTVSMSTDAIADSDGSDDMYPR